MTRPKPRSSATPSFLSNVKTLLERREWTAPELARRARISPKTLNNLLNGRHAAQFDTLQKIADAFGLELWLMFLPQLPDTSTNKQIFIYFVTHAAKLPTESVERVANFVDFELSRGR